MQIICVDDEEIVLSLTVSMCKELAQKPEVAGFDSPVKALEWLRDHKADIAILDINMPDMDGLQLAARIKELHPETAIIFLTGYSEYAVDAYAMHASGYLMKPVSKERVAEEVNYALQTHLPQISAHIHVRTFGKFDVLVDGKPINFNRSKSKELLAYLVDRQGGVTRAEAFSVLYETGVYDRSRQKQLDVIIRSLRDTLREYGISEILELHKGILRVVPDKFDCDLYRFMQGDAAVVNTYRGEYLSDYSWGSITEAYMDSVINKE